MSLLIRLSEDIVVLALGGNAIATKSRTFDSQHDALKVATKQIANIAKNGYKLVITHGNGPQVGDALLRNERAKEIVPPLPLYGCVAGTQGVLGAMIQAALLDHLGNDFKIASVVTKVTVLADDPAFKNPTKPIGPTFTKKVFQEMKKEPSATFKEISPGKYRRVVPSPKPTSILELDAVKDLVKNNYIVVACGGGGIPVIKDKKIRFSEAVIDKDLASELLARGLDASVFASLTDVDGVYLNYKSKDQKLLRKIQANKMKELLEEGFFEEGSMKPKVRAAVQFASNTGKNAVIASLEKVRQAVELKSGTIVYK